MRLFIVCGLQGEYSDFRTWVVAAYTDEAMAREHAEKATEWNRANRARRYYSDDPIQPS